MSSDEIKMYLDARYLSSIESCWRIFGFTLHDNRPNIYRLEVHLEGHQMVTFNSDENPADVVSREKKTKLMAWLNYNGSHTDGLYKISI
jgi:hypothetical protein